MHIVHPGGPARVVYLGTPEIAVAPLRALVDAGHDVALVVTNPDRRRGRGKDLMATPVKAAALELGLAVSHDLDDVLAAGADFGVVVAYGHIIGNHVLDEVPMVNIHFSLLPRWRGAAPLERAILAGDEKTGVCLMAIAEASCELLTASLRDGLGEPQPQVGEVTYAKKLKPADFVLDFSQPASQLNRIIRLGRAHTTLDGKRFAIKAATVDPTAHDFEPGALHGVQVATGDGSLVLQTVQPEGKKPVAAADWQRGARLEPSVLLGA